MITLTQLSHSRRRCRGRRCPLDQCRFCGGSSALRRCSRKARTISSFARVIGVRDDQVLAPGQPGKDYTPVITPNGAALPFKIVDGVKVFHLIAEEVVHEFAPGLKASSGAITAVCTARRSKRSRATASAFTSRTNCPRRPPCIGTAWSCHRHGRRRRSGSAAIKPGETFKYEYTLLQHGTLMYHSHHDEMTQMGMGMMGMFIMHPRRPRVRPDRDFVIMLSEWQVEAGTYRPDPNGMTDFNT